jgi:hypothetical protein
MLELIQEIREILPRVYGQLTGYRGNGGPEQDTWTRIIAASFWDDEDANEGKRAHRRAQHSTDRSGDWDDRLDGHL